MKHCYYLHENGELIHKRADLPGIVEGIRESNFAKALWFFNPADRQSAWDLLVEALSIGANKKRIDELAQKWKCDDEDAQNYAKEIRIILSKDGNQKAAMLTNFENLQESPCGFGDNYLYAISDLCKQLGYAGDKMWNNSFENLVKEKMQAVPETKD